MALDLATMLTSVEENTFYLTASTIILVFIAYQIGSVRSMFHGLLAAGLTALSCGMLFSQFLSENAYARLTAIGIVLLIIAVLTIWLTINKDVK